MPKLNFTRKTVKLDATGMAVGRLSTKVCELLRGKDEPEYQPNQDRGAIVEIINVDKMTFTGKKLDQKVYHHFTGYPSGIRTKKALDIFTKDPGDILKRAVREMLPDTRLRAGMMNRLIIK